MCWLSVLAFSAFGLMPISCNKKRFFKTTIYRRLVFLRMPIVHNYISLTISQNGRDDRRFDVTSIVRSNLLPWRTIAAESLDSSEIIATGKCQWQRFIIIEIFLFFRLFGLLTELCIPQMRRKIVTHMLRFRRIPRIVGGFIGTSGQLNQWKCYKRVENLIVIFKFFSCLFFLLIRRLTQSNSYFINFEKLFSIWLI